jgi:hypothetical protein
MACQKRTMLSNAESRSPVCRSARNLLTESKVSELSTAELTSKTWGDGDLIAFESARRGRIPLRQLFGKCIASARYDRTTWRGKWSRVALVAHQVVRSKGMSYGISRLRLYSESGRAEPGLLSRIEMCALWFSDSGALN